MLWCSVDTRASLWRHCTHSLPSGGSCAHEHDTLTVTSPCYLPLQTAERFLLLLSRICFILEETMLQLKDVSCRCSCLSLMISLWWKPQTLVLRLKQHFPSELTDDFKHTRKGEQRLNAATVKTILIILQ